MVAVGIFWCRNLTSGTGKPCACDKFVLSQSPRPKPKVISTVQLHFDPAYPAWGSFVTIARTALIDDKYFTGATQ